MASAMSQSIVPLQAHAPRTPPTLNSSGFAKITFLGPKGTTPLSSGPRNPRPVRSMLDIDVPAPGPTIAEKKHSNDGSEELQEPLTPTSRGASPRLQYVVSDATTTKLADSIKPLSASETPSAAPKSAYGSVDIARATRPSVTTTPEPGRALPRQSNSSPTKAQSPTSTSPTSPKSANRPSLVKKAKSFLRRSHPKLDTLIDQYAPTAKDQLDGVPSPSRTTMASQASESKTPTFSSRSSHTSHTNSPSSPETPSSTIDEVVEEVDNNRLTKSKTSASVTNLNRLGQPRLGITWAGSPAKHGLHVPLSHRKRSISTEQLPQMRKPNQQIEEGDEDEHFEAPLQATFSTRAAEGVGLKARRLSLTLPDDFVVLTKSLEKEYRSTKVFHSKGTLVGKGATAKVTTMCRRDGPKDELYAVKEFRDRDRDETEYDWSQKIKSEYTLANSVNHPNIVRTFELCIDKHKRYNHVMEFCPIELFTLAEKGLFKTFYDEKAKLCFFKQILRAVAYLHEHGIAHRDIKMENILMDAEGHLKLTDFGVSEVFCGEHPGARSSGGRCGLNMGERKLCPPGICGSLPFLSPEVIAKEDSYDPSKLDVWSCGVLWMCFAFAGNLWQVPDMKNPNYARFMDGWSKWMAEHPDCVPNEETGYPKCGQFMTFIGPPSLKKLILRMMHPDPDRRITIQEALNNPVIRSAECCSPESFEDAPHAIDASKKYKPGSVVKQFKHNHLPPRGENRVARAFSHRFEMGDGYS